jgi:hypothetical protein
VYVDPVNDFIRHLPITGTRVDMHLVSPPF